MNISLIACGPQMDMGATYSGDITKYLNLSGEYAVSNKQGQSPEAKETVSFKERSVYNINISGNIPYTMINLEAGYEYAGKAFENNTLPVIMAGTERFRISGKGDLFLAVGSVLGSLVGTTGASALLVRPLLRANEARERKAHIFVFFIFIASNCGGLLTPLGDPPLFLGFLHGGTGEPLQMAATRFSIQLPPDNVMPGYFADWFFQHGHQGTTPLFPGEWLSSDRPPLQIGYVLSQRGYGWDTNGLHTQVLGVVLQQLNVIHRCHLLIL